MVTPIRTGCGQGPDYCAVAPDSRTISVHTGVSLATKAVNSSGEPGRSSTLSLVRLSLASGERRMSLRVALSLPTIGAAALGGAMMPAHGLPGESAKPASPTAGTPG